MKRCLIPFLFIFSGLAQSASFDCTKAHSFSEKEICSDPSLSQEDDELFAIFKSVREKSGNSKDFKQMARRLWNEREECQSNQCVTNWYAHAKEIYLTMLNVPSSEAGAAAHSSPSSPSEDAFIQAVKSSQTSSEQAKNDMVRGGIKARRDRELCKVISSKSVINWRGKVTKLDANSDGKGVLEVEISDGISLKTWNNSLSDMYDNTLIDPGTDLFEAASSLSKGQDVTFSGDFASDQNKGECAKEASFGLQGGLREPEFIFRFSSIKTASPLEPVATEQQKKTAREIYNILLKGFTKSCVLIGQGDDNGAISAVNDMIFPGNQKNPVTMEQGVFLGMKDYFMQYRNLNEQNCESYARGFISYSMQQ